MVKKNIFDLENRRKIYNHILKHPGLHKRELCRQLNLSYSNTKYHLNYLEQKKLIIKRAEDRFVRYYISNNVSETDKKILHLLRQNFPRKIILFLDCYSDATLSSIAKFWNKDPRTIAFHMNKLEKIGIIQRVPEGNKIIFKLTNNELLYDALITYENSLIDGLSKSYIKWLCFEGVNNIADNISKVMWEICPHPYHI